MNLEFHPAAQRDVNETAAYYEKEGSPALAIRFFKAVQTQLEKIAAHPERFSSYPPAPRY